jgi:hypothetical protein
MLISYARTLINVPPFSPFSFYLVPGSPADIKVVVSSPQALFISWLPPLEPNGVITKYILYTRYSSKQNIQRHVISIQSNNKQELFEVVFSIKIKTASVSFLHRLAVPPSPGQSDSPFIRHDFYFL